MTAKLAASFCGYRGSAGALLRRLERESILYFIENQLSHGLILDRQRNFGRRSTKGLISLSATGMGLIALALAAEPENALLSKKESRRRIRLAIKTALKLPHVDGMLPHFVDSETLKPVGSDAISTIDSAWLFGGALWAARFTGDREIQRLANKLFERVDWNAWSNGAPAPLLHHGAAVDGKKLTSVWDRFNAETAFMYVLAIGADKGNGLPASSWNAMQLFMGTLGGRTFAGADLGLFTFQYSNLLLDSAKLPKCNGKGLLEEGIQGTLANYEVAAAHRGRYQTFNTFWGVSAGDGPPDKPGEPDAYRAYDPQSLDGTAHIEATIASIEVAPEHVLANLLSAEQPDFVHLHGRYGYSNVNVDRGFASSDVVGIDVGAALFGLDNMLHDERVRKVFMRLKPVRRFLRRTR
jgi:hypothetical protein